MKSASSFNQIDRCAVLRIAVYSIVASVPSFADEADSHLATGERDGIGLSFISAIPRLSRGRDRRFHAPKWRVVSGWVKPQHLVLQTEVTGLGVHVIA